MRLKAVWCACSLFVFTSNCTAILGQDDDVFFETKIRPVLASSCIECHGPTKASGGLRLDTREGLAQGGESGKPIDVGDIDGSLLIRAIRRDAEIQMPPEKPLEKQEIEDIVAWVAKGAQWPKTVSAPIPSDQPHWAFQPLTMPPVPSDPTGWAQQPIDRFIADAMLSRGLQPSNPANKNSLIRRAYYDLVGLPPTPEQIELFLRDESPGAFARVIDDLLSSPRYGERWGRHWLDLVRYADTAGDNADYPIPQAHLYRDYVIDSFNADVPYDRFLHEQLAGDILAQSATASDYARLVTATGFIAQSKRIGTRELEDMHLIIEDTLTTFGPVVMGLSLRCARCHDHKYEPLTMQDYYAFYGFFASTQYPFAGAEEVRKQTKFAPLIPPAQVRAHLAQREAKLAGLKSEIESIEASSETGLRIRQLNQVLADAQQQLQSSEAALQDKITEKIQRTQRQLDEAKKELQQLTGSLREQLTNLEKQDPLIGIPTAYAVGESTPTDAPIQPAGNPRNADGTPVQRGVPKVLDQTPLSIPQNSSGRLELAKWLTTRASHLTSRVMANRVWQYHFGKPLVPTPSDYGLRGALPTHPELLEWLAHAFIDSGWSVKQLHRIIMLSKTYQQASSHDEKNFQLDSGNAWYWRFDRRRLDAESLRDSVMLLSGTLNMDRPGPHPFPDPAQWRFTAHRQFNQVCYPSDHRSVYLMVQRLHAHPYLSLFNGPDPSLSTPSRDNSTVPLQALYLLNNEFVHQASSKFAQSLIQSHTEPSSRVISLYRQAFGRTPAQSEIEKRLAQVAAYSQVLAEDNVPSSSLEQETWASLVRAVFASNGFFYLD